MSTNKIIEVENVSKEYRLGVVNHGMLYKDIQSWWAKFRGKPDPNTLITEHPIEDDDRERLQGDKFLALEDISFTVNEGEVLGIIGRNGAGKSTLLKLLSRITLPSKGTIKARGRIASLLEVGTGFHPELSGRDNIYLNGTILGMSKQEISKSFDEIVEFSEIGKFIDTPVKRYSSGMYVRLAFAVAAHLDPEVLIVDEVLAVGDLAFQKKCLGKMKLSGREGKTVIFVSHNLTAVNQLCTRSILLHKGKLVTEGETSEVVKYYTDMMSEKQAATKEYNKPLTEGLAALRKISVMNKEGTVSESLKMSEEFIIEVVYEIGSPVSSLMVGITVIAEENNQLILSAPDAELEPELLNKRQPGTYVGKIVIPPMLLNSGSYRVSVGIIRNRMVLDSTEEVIFHIHDDKGKIQELGYERKNSLLSLQRPWDIQNVSI